MNNHGSVYFYIVAAIVGVIVLLAMLWLAPAVDGLPSDGQRYGAVFEKTDTTRPWWWNIH